MIVSARQFRWLLAMVAIFLAGCQYDDSNAPRMSPYSYDVHRYNQIAEAADPFTHNAWQRSIPGDGQRAVKAIERYRSGALPAGGSGKSGNSASSSGSTGSSLGGASSGTNQGSIGGSP